MKTIKEEIDAETKEKFKELNEKYNNSDFDQKDKNGDQQQSKFFDGSLKPEDAIITKDNNEIYNEGLKNAKDTGIKNETADETKPTDDKNATTDTVAKTDTTDTQSV